MRFFKVKVLTFEVYRLFCIPCSCLVKLIPNLVHVACASILTIETQHKFEFVNTGKALV